MYVSEKGNKQDRMEAPEGYSGGDDSILYQASTDLASDDSDDDMYSDKESKVTPSDMDESDVEIQIDILKGLLVKMGLIYKDVVTKSTKTIKGMVICNMNCQINTKTRLHVKQVRKDMSDAIIASVRDIVAQVKRNLNSNEMLAEEKQNLAKFCQESRKVEPEYESWVEDGLYRAKVVWWLVKRRLSQEWPSICWKKQRGQLRSCGFSCGVEWLRRNLFLVRLLIWVIMKMFSAKIIG